MSELEYWKNLHRKQLEFTQHKMDEIKELKKRIAYLEEEAKAGLAVCKACWKISKAAHTKPVIGDKGIAL